MWRRPLKMGDYSFTHQQFSIFCRYQHFLIDPNECFYYKKKCGTKEHIYKKQLYDAQLMYMMKMIC